MIWLCFGLAWSVMALTTAITLYPSNIKATTKAQLGCCCCCSSCWCGFASADLYCRCRGVISAYLRCHIYWRRQRLTVKALARLGENDCSANIAPVGNSLECGVRVIVVVVSHGEGRGDGVPVLTAALTAAVELRSCQPDVITPAACWHVWLVLAALPVQFLMYSISPNVYPKWTVNRRARRGVGFRAFPLWRKCVWQRCYSGQDYDYNAENYFSI